MTEGVFLTIMQQGLVVAAQLLAPLLLISAAVGLLVGIFQAVTQINEMTLTFIPKILVVGLVLMFLGSWMMNMMMDFTRDLILSIPGLIHS